MHQKIEEVKEKYETLRKFAQVAQETECVIYRLCNTEAKQSNEDNFVRKLQSSVRKQVTEYCRKQGVSRPIPSARHGNRSYLTDTLRNVHEEFMDNMNLTDQNISISSFYRSIPEDVRTSEKTPHILYTCESCTNLENAAAKLLEYNAQNISYHRKCIIDSSWCQYKARQFSYSEKNFDSEERQFPSKKCILRTCDNCGVARVKSLMSQGLSDEKLKKVVTWKVWKYVDEEYDVYQVNGTITELIYHYVQLVDINSFHVFMSYYQDHQYNLCLKNVCKGQVIFVHDYAQNILMKNQDEVQTKHWSHRQLTVHPSIACYLCPNCEKVLVRETILHLTEDRKHDWKAVCHFQNLNLQHLIAEKVPVCQIHEWSDQAPTQYKSRKTFNVQSNSVIPLNRHFYCSRHGKGPSDRATGLFKLWLNLQVKTGKLILHDYGAIAKYATEHHSKQPNIQGECLHTRRKIFYTSKIPCKKFTHFEDHTKTAKEHRLIHSA